MTSRLAALALALSTACLIAPGLAAAADAVRGEQLGYTCHGCHGIENYKNAFPVYSVPKLGGQHAAYLVAALEEYSSKNRNHATMHSHAVTMTKQDMQDVAAFLAGEERKPAGKAVGAAPKAAQTCIACHGSDGVGILPEYPVLAGQHADYLEVALKAYRSGQRKNPVMAGMAAGLTDLQIRELARYYSSQQPSLCATDETRDDGKCDAW
jgi:cytochrome c553